MLQIKQLLKKVERIFKVIDLNLGALEINGDDIEANLQFQVPGRNILIGGCYEQAYFFPSHFSRNGLKIY